MNKPVKCLTSGINAGAPKWCDLSFGDRVFTCRHADESSIASIVNGDRELVTFGLLIDDPQGHAAMFVALPPDAARGVASALIEAANRADHGKGKQ